MSSDEVMTIGDVAEFLHMAVATVKSMAERGELPCFKPSPNARSWRFLKPVLIKKLSGE